MIKEILIFARKIKSGEAELPPVLSVLQTLRENRNQNIEDGKFMQQVSNNTSAEGFKILNVYENMRIKQHKDYVFEVQAKLVEFESI